MIWAYSQLKRIIPQDLLGRELVSLKTQKTNSFLQNKIIIITGAGGSIGQELCFQIARQEPALLIAFEQTEFTLYKLEKNIKLKYPLIKFIPIIGDVRSFEKVKSIFKKYRPDVCFHAAAYKHVPIMEINPLESIQTNVYGTLNVARSASEFNTNKFILISTDKAINPTNVMGTTKRIAEMVCQHLQSQSNTKYITIRFGNVLGSSGSVVPLFKEQIKNQQFVTVTHPEIKRYFMSIQEACQLVIETSSFENSRSIFALDMGRPVKILDLAKGMITLAGFIPNKDIKIKYTGLRPGEKLFEQVFSDSEKNINTLHPKIKAARMVPLHHDFNIRLNKLLELSVDSTLSDIYDHLKDIVHEYQFNKNVSP